MLYLLLAWALVAAPEVQVRLLDGSSVRGTLQSLSGTSLTVKTDESTRALEASAIQSLSPVGSAPVEPAPAAAVLEFADGSLAAFQKLEVTGNRLQFMTDLGSLQGDIRQVQWIRFKPQDAALGRQWRQIAAAPRKADLLVVRKTSTANDASGTPQNVVALDYLEGLVRDIRPDGIQFEYDGDLIDVKLEKVDGIFYYRGANAQSALPPRICQLHDTSNSQWNLASLEWTNDQLSVQSAAGVRFTLPLSALRRLDYSVVNTLYLSDVEPEEVLWHDSLTRLSQAVPSLAKRYEPRRDISALGGPLSMGGQTFDKGWAVYCGTKLSFRLPETYQRLRGTVGFDDRARGGGSLKLTILGDGKELFARELRASQDAPIPLDLPIAGVRRVTVQVDYGDNKLQTNYVDLADLRVNK